MINEALVNMISVGYRGKNEDKKNDWKLTEVIICLHLSSEL